MHQRIAYGTMAIVLVVGLAVADVAVAYYLNFDGKLGDLIRRGSVIPIGCTLIALLGAIEMSRIFDRIGARPHKTFAYVMIALMMLSPWLSAAGLLGQQSAELEGLYWQVIWMLAAVVGTGVLTVLRRTPEGTTATVGATLIMIFCLGFLLSFAVQIRCGRDTPGTHGVWLEGAWLLAITVLVIKSGDIGAYFVGSLFGRHKLIPSISGKKTIEGAVGGLLAAGLVAVAISGASSLADAGWIPDTSRLALVARMTTRSFGQLCELGYTPAVLPAAIFGVCVAAAGQFGDLFESCFKREAGVKDSGHLIPQFGGILDLIDSPMLAVPVAWFLLTAVWGII